MEAIFIGLMVLGGLLAVPVIIFVRLAGLRRRIEDLESEVARLRYLESRAPGAARAETATDAEPGTLPDWLAPAAEPSGGLMPGADAAASASAPAAAPHAEPVTPAPTSSPASPAAAWPLPPAARSPFPPPPGPRPAPAASPFPPPPGPRPAPSSFPPPPGPRPEPATAAHRPLDASSLEQLVGGVWLQNLGSVVLLLGIFLMIVWGYTTGRFGPQVLVVSGVALGLALAWRGDRVSRRTPPFGHALIGVGLGAVYLTLYLGYIRLHVLGPAAALALLSLVSFVAIAAGLRYRVQAIAAFGVVGAFLPQFMARWLGMPGFEIAPAFLLGYLAAIDLLVFALAARAGWSGLDLVAIVLSALTWLTAFDGPDWGWGIQCGLAALFTVLGLAPLPRLVRVEGRVRPQDLAVVASAPLALLAASAPFLSWADRGQVAMLLFALAAVMLGAALWVDSRRPERDLWVPLTAAATLFVTAGLERAIGPVYTALAWAAEGVVLLLLGLRPRGSWLRAMGHVVLLIGAVTLLARLDAGGWTRDQWPVFYGAGIRDLLCVLALLAAAGALARRRQHLGEFEHDAPEAWTVVGHLLLAYWLFNQSNHLASALTESGGRFHAPPPPVGIELGDRRTTLAAALCAVAWLAQAAVLAWRGARGALPLRLCGWLLGLAALLAACFRPNVGWWTDLRPFVHPTALLDLLSVGLMVAIALRYAAQRDHLPATERRTAEVWATAASLLLMLWSVRETRHLAQAMVRPDAFVGEPSAPELLRRERALGAAFASVAWLLQAVLVLVVGWARDSAFLRWSGLVLLGLTLFKFLIFDLQTIDVFWRFLTAIAVGAAMLAFSYAYQRRTRATKPGS